MSIVLLALISLFHAASAAVPEKPEFAWTELGQGGKVVVRTVAGNACPVLTADGAEIPMSRRSAPTPEFPTAVCEGFPPAGAASLRVNGIPVPAWNQAPKRILFVGDTGCRIKKNKDGSLLLQACNDPEKWPFARVMESAAAWKPDLVVHVGDYHYREADCPANVHSCSGSETGDRWNSWRQDFFAPAKPLLETAPWVFARGNHELCRRAGIGWFLLLDPNPLSKDCSDATVPYEVPFRGHRIHVIDAADDNNIAPSLAAIPASSDFIWLLLHRPFLTSGADDETKLHNQLPSQLAGAGKVSAVFTGHVHTLSLNRFKDARPPELITGNGGDLLEKLRVKDNASFESSRFFDFGFLTLERESSGGSWKIEEHDRNGKVVLKCRLHEKAGRKTLLSCKS